MPNGILCIDKPRGLTSHDVVDVVRRLAGLRAVGHTGTLDPEASGLMLLCLGRATKFARFFEGLYKTYWTVMRLGECTDTQDATGQPTFQCQVPPLTPLQIDKILPRFTGPIKQTPPMYSAIKYHGKRLYQLARQGQMVARKAREVYIQRCELLDLRGVQVTLCVTCSKGTYIRTLCEDIGIAMGYGAHMVHLQRCHVGSFCLKQAHSLDSLERTAQEGNLSNHIIPLAHALDFIPALSLNSQQFQTLQTAQKKTLSTLLGTLPEPTIKATSYRLRMRQTQETFAIIHRHTTDADRWKLSYLENP